MGFNTKEEARDNLERFIKANETNQLEINFLFSCLDKLQEECE